MVLMRKVGGKYGETVPDNEVAAKDCDVRIRDSETFHHDESC